LDTPILERVLNTYSKERKTRLLLPYGGVELFYKEDEQSLFPICKKSARFEDGWRYCSKCQDLFINHIVCPRDGIKLRNSPRKKKKGSNGKA
jgi:hypothetical protein